MNTPHAHMPCWSTASVCTGTDAVPTEITVLGKHLSLCRNQNIHLSEAKFFVDGVHGFMMGRLVTTLVVAIGLIGAASFTQ